MSGIGERAGWGSGSSLPDKSDGRGHCSFSKTPTLHRADRRALYLRLHQCGSYCVPPTSDSLRLGCTQLTGLMDPFPGHFHRAGLSCLVLQTFLKSLKHAASGPYLLLSGLRPGTSSSWPSVAASPLPGTSKPKTSNRHLQIIL